MLNPDQAAEWVKTHSQVQIKAIALDPQQADTPIGAACREAVVEETADAEA